MNQFLMVLIALGVVCGGVDRLLGNRFGLGARFDEAFNLLGPLALSMAGIMCLMPVLSGWLERVIAPLYLALGIDPGIFGGVLAIDMGGYQLAMELAVDPAVGRFAGTVIAATFGCTVVFTIPLGMQLMPDDARPAFARGLVLGLIALPLALLAGGLLCGLSLGRTLWQCVPVMLISALLLWGLLCRPKGLVRGFGGLARVLQALTTVGLVLGAVQHLTGWVVFERMPPLEEAMGIIASIAVVMLGSLPLAELLQRALKRPLERFGRLTGMNSTGTTALIISIISITPVLGMFRRMDPRSRVVNAAAAVCGASALAAHFGFTVAVEPDLAVPLVISKLLGAAIGAALALFCTRKDAPSAEADAA